MKEKLIRMLEMRFIERTKHNEIYQNETHVLIFNVVTGIIKIKPKVK